MKPRFTFLLILSFFIFSLTAKSQTSDWTPVFIDASGGHTKNGVEVYFKQSACDADGVIFIRFVNTNSYPVSLEWYNAVFTQELAWIHKPEDIKTIIVPASTTLEGTCTGEVMLVVNLSDFISDPVQFKRLSTTELLINAAN